MHSLDRQSAPLPKITKDRYKLCPSCGNFSHFSEGLSYCIICGAKMLCECPECCEPILYPTAKHCPDCGTAYGAKYAEALKIELKAKIG
ncbi:MAG: hypothetical protein ACM3Q4_14545 [Acidobacteriota bacterium]